MKRDDGIRMGAKNANEDDLHECGFFGGWMGLILFLGELLCLEWVLWVVGGMVCGSWKVEYEDVKIVERCRVHNF